MVIFYSFFVQWLLDQHFQLHYTTLICAKHIYWKNLQHFPRNIYIQYTWPFHKFPSLCLQQKHAILLLASSNSDWLGLLNCKNYKLFSPNYSTICLPWLCEVSWLLVLPRKSSRKSINLANFSWSNIWHTVHCATLGLRNPFFSWMWKRWMFFSMNVADFYELLVASYLYLFGTHTFEFGLVTSFLTMFLLSMLHGSFF